MRRLQPAQQTPHLPGHRAPMQKGNDLLPPAALREQAQVPPMENRTVPFISSV